MKHQPNSTTSTATIDGSSWPQSLIDVLDRQHALVASLASLSEEQASLIADGRSDRLLELLARRQSIIDEFTVCQTQMTVLSHELDRRMHEVSPSHRSRIGELVGSIGERLRSVMDRDQKDQASLQRGRSSVMAEISGLDAGRQARNAYSPAIGAGSSSLAAAAADVGGATNRFADRTG